MIKDECGVSAYGKLLEGCSTLVTRESLPIGVWANLTNVMLAGMYLLHRNYPKSEFNHLWNVLN